jgi:hypothetical protein
MLMIEVDDSDGSGKVPKGIRARQSTKKEAARRQIEAAIRLYHAGEWECAITLAGAAEGQLPEPTANHLFGKIRGRRPEEFKNEKEWTTFLNETRDWLKHNHDQGPRDIVDFEALIMLWRALTKFYENFGEETREMSEFLRWGQQQGYTKPKAEV